MSTGGGGVLLAILGGGVPPGSPNPDLISDQKISFSRLFLDLAFKIYSCDLVGRSTRRSLCSGCELEKNDIPEYYHTIHWIEIYPLESIIQCLNNWGLKKFTWFHCSTQRSDKPSGMLVMSTKVPNGTKTVPRQSFYERWIQCFLLIQKKENELLKLSVLPSSAKDGASLAIVVFKLTDQTFLVQEIEQLSQSETVSLTQ